MSPKQTAKTPARKAPPRDRIAAQSFSLADGNEMAAVSAYHVDFHLMGYYPITPSTAVAETLDEMKAEGLHSMPMVPAEGEHSAAGICFGASAGGARVLNATSANGFLYAIEQMPVQSGLRIPMVLDVATRTVSGPLDIKGDHSDMMMALNTGWIILLGKDPQMVYDMNIIAVKLGEHPEVRLPVMVCYDGFFTSHQKRRVSTFDDPGVVRKWVGPRTQANHVLDPAHPVTCGPYMNEPDLINNKKQLSLAMEAAYRALPGIFNEYGKISGRTYSLLNTYRMEDADTALFLLNSAFDTAKIAVDRLREQGKKVGIVSANVIRPFPKEQLAQVFARTRALLVGDRADSYGAWNGNMAMEIKAALKDDPDNRTLVISRVYGLGGREFLVEDAEQMFSEALEAAESGEVAVPFDYHGATPGNPGAKMEPVVRPLAGKDLTLGLSVEEKDGQFLLQGYNKRFFAAKPKRLVPGHGACPGCGIFPNLNIFLKGIEGNAVMLFHTGCGMVVTTGYPYSAHRTTYMHNLFQSGAATLSGLVEAYHERVKRGELPGGDDITFIMVTGDGGNDIGMGSTLGAALRNHRMIVLEYDNQAYMNTGTQLSFSTPLGHSTSTSHVGPGERGKSFHHKDTVQIMAATNAPYVFTGAESNPRDLIRKAAVAQKVAREEGFAFGKVISFCPLGWRCKEDQAADVIGKAVDSCFFPLYEVRHGKTRLNYDPEEKGKKLPVMDWLKTMGKTRHLTKPEYADVVEAFQREVDRRWARLRAMHASPLL